MSIIPATTHAPYVGEPVYRYNDKGELISTPMTQAEVDEFNARRQAYHAAADALLDEVFERLSEILSHLHTGASFYRPWIEGEMNAQHGKERVQWPILAPALSEAVHHGTLVVHTSDTERTWTKT